MKKHFVQNTFLIFRRRFLVPKDNIWREKLVNFVACVSKYRTLQSYGQIVIYINLLYKGFNVIISKDHHMKMIWYMIVESINVKTFFRSQRWKLSATSHVAKFYNAYWACRVKTYRWKPLSYISFFLYISRVILLLQTQVYINKKSVEEKLFVKYPRSTFHILSLTWQWMNHM